ncbi:MAG: hypothetical protein JJT95_13070 [Pararhodobacter sp.]|nr:hypothetical protein [Pararhodobacter sp.]
MRFEQSKVIKKPAVPVTVHLVNGEVLKGFVFVQREGRVLDAIENREYFPLRMLEGVSLIRSNNVIRLEILTYEEFLAEEHAFPGADHEYLRSQKW